jgi:hypothetical protein
MYVLELYYKIQIVHKSTLLYEHAKLISVSLKGITQIINEGSI